MGEPRPPLGDSCATTHPPEAYSLSALGTEVEMEEVGMVEEEMEDVEVVEEEMEEVTVEEEMEVVEKGPSVSSCVAK